MTAGWLARETDATDQLVTSGDVTPDPFSDPAELLSESVVRAFVEDAIATRLQAESLVLEFKSKREGTNVARAVAAMANTDGGLILVGIDETSPEDPLVGITAVEVDGVVRQLRALVPTSMPEVIPVALEGADRAVLVLRVDPDRVERPVVIDGRVMKRVPGHSVGATRDEIVALATAFGAAYGAQGAIPIDPGNVQTWSSEAAPNELRMHGQILLPRHAASIPYMGSPSIRAALESLDAGPVPNLICTEHLRTHELGNTYWERDESTSLRLQFSCGPRENRVRGVPRFQALAKVRLSGRMLDTVIAVRQPEGEAGDDPLTLTDIADLLLSTSHAAVTLSAALSGAIGAAHPAQPPTLEAWMNGPVGPSRLMLDRRWEAKPSDLAEYRFLNARPQTRRLPDLQSVVATWLTALLLDLGAIDVEPDLQRLDLPRWARTMT